MDQLGLETVRIITEISAQKFTCWDRAAPEFNAPAAESGALAEIARADNGLKKWLIVDLLRFDTGDQEPHTSR